MPAKARTIKVQVLKADGSVEPRAIKIGIKSEISAEVTDGLKEKEQVVIRANHGNRAARRKAR